jgi:hypothetical protein
MAELGSRETLPIAIASPVVSSIIAWILAVQHRRLATSGWITGPEAISAQDPQIRRSRASEDCDPASGAEPRRPCIPHP